MLPRDTLFQKPLLTEIRQRFRKPPGQDELHSRLNGRVIALTPRTSPLRVRRLHWTGLLSQSVFACAGCEEEGADHSEEVVHRVRRVCHELDHGLRGIVMLLPHAIIAGDALLTSALLVESKTMGIVPMPLRSERSSSDQKSEH